MKVHRDLARLPSFKKAVITTGTFDGVHHGHRMLVRRITDRSREISGESVLVTFEPHPRSVVFPEDASLKILTTLEEKVRLLEALQVDHLVVTPFDKPFSLLSAQDYIAAFLVKHFQPAVIVIGYNHQFGHHRDGNIELLRKMSPIHHFAVEEIPKQMVDSINVSSTRIRIALQEGAVKKAALLLGYAYGITGLVVRGNQLGRKLGYPTANLLIGDPLKLIPADGVYAVEVLLPGGEKKKGAASIGFRPTVNGRARTVEVYLMDFSADLYDAEITIGFKEWIREERKFETVNLMIEEIGRDVQRAREILG